MEPESLVPKPGMKERMKAGMKEGCHQLLKPSPMGGEGILTTNPPPKKKNKKIFI